MTSLESMFSGGAIIYEASLFRGSQEQSPPPATGIPPWEHQRAFGKQESSMHCGGAAPFTDWSAFS